MAVPAALPAAAGTTPAAAVWARRRPRLPGPQADAGIAACTRPRLCPNSLAADARSASSTGGAMADLLAVAPPPRPPRAPAPEPRTAFAADRDRARVALIPVPKHMRSPWIVGHAPLPMARAVVAAPAPVRLVIPPPEEAAGAFARAGSGFRRSPNFHRVPEQVALMH